MEWEQPGNGGNGQGPVCLSPGQLTVFKSMVLLPKADRREILDMVIMYELVEGQPEGEALRARL